MAKPIPVLHLFGFGSQAQAWASAMRRHSWQVQVYLRDPSKLSSHTAWSESDLKAFPIEAAPDQIQEHPGPIALLVTDRAIAEVYSRYLESIPSALHLILAHGLAVTAGWLRPKPQHRLTLLAPKAIGQELEEHHARHFPGFHGLKAAFAPDLSPALLPGSLQSAHAEASALAGALGFSPSNLVTCTFDQETLGDLISEQGLLCGGLWSLLKWTLEEMLKAGIPNRLIQEECFRELELIASILRQHGPEGTFKRISDTALEGAIQMQAALERSTAKLEFSKQIATIMDGRFFDSLSSQSQARQKRLEAVSHTWGQLQERLAHDQPVSGQLTD